MVTRHRPRHARVGPRAHLRAVLLDQRPQRQRSGPGRRVQHHHPPRRRDRRSSRASARARRSPFACRTRRVRRAAEGRAARSMACPRRMAPPAERLGPRLAPSRNALKGARILVVDDEPGLVAIVRQFMERSGASVSIANGGQAALDGARGARPEVRRGHHRPGHARGRRLGGRRGGQSRIARHARGDADRLGWRDRARGLQLARRRRRAGQAVQSGRARGGHRQSAACPSRRPASTCCWSTTSRRLPGPCATCSALQGHHVTVVDSARRPSKRSRRTPSTWC